MEPLGHGPQDGIGLDELDLGGEELIGVVGGVRVASWPTTPAGTWRSTSTVAVDS